MDFKLGQHCHICYVITRYFLKTADNIALYLGLYCVVLCFLFACYGRANIENSTCCIMFKKIHMPLYLKSYLTPWATVQTDIIKFYNKDKMGKKNELCRLKLLTVVGIWKQVVLIDAYCCIGYILCTIQRKQMYTGHQ